MSFKLGTGRIAGLSAVAMLAWDAPAEAQDPCFFPPTLKPPTPSPINETLPGLTRAFKRENGGLPGCAGADRSGDDGQPGYPGQPGGAMKLNAPSAAITIGTGEFGVAAGGGDGGAGGWADFPVTGRTYGGDGAIGGAANLAQLVFSGYTQSSQGLIALANGGQGGGGGGVEVSAANVFAGDGGAGGAGGTATLDATGTGPWNGLAEAWGGKGGDGGYTKFGFLDTQGGDGGVGGNAGTASLSAGLGGGVTTTNQLISRAVGGEGGKGGTAGSLESAGGSGGNGGHGGTATLTIGRGVSVLWNIGGTSLLPALLVQSDGGVGGAGGDDQAGIGEAGGGGLGGPGGSSAATVDGTVITDGEYSHGALVQSIGGGGGAGGNATGFFVTGGAGLTGGKGGAVSIDATTGHVTVTGQGSIALLGQSIGGGGGSGGDALSISAGAVTGVAIGGNGGLGGDGGDVTFDLKGGIYTSVSTAGGAGILAQSIGGAGGSGGNAGAKGVSPFQLSIGGDAKGGGVAGSVSVANAGIVTTFGDHATGIEAQSIGGGGGKGGSALTFGLSALPIGVAVGGRGGGGGPAGTAGVTNAMQVVTYGPDAPGVRAQSIGGGGGHGGTAVATAIGLSPDPEIPGVSISVAVGGKGGDGNTGSTATITNSGFVATSGHGSFPLMAQSIGGGGGAGGDSTAASYTAGDGETNISIAVAIGGSGGSGGIGGAVEIDNKGLLMSLGQSSYGVFGQSIGGGGGVGGGGDASSSSVKGQTLSFSASLAVGGTGGTGGDAGKVTIGNAGGVATTGDGADGLFAQSVGGGGGDGGGGVGKSNAGNLSISVGIGGSGGAGGDGGTAEVGNTGGIATIGTDAIGMTAQSVGGGGGRGGKGGATAGGAPKDTDQTLVTTITGGLNIGQNTQSLGNGVVKVGDGMLNGITGVDQLSKIVGGEAAGGSGEDGTSKSIQIGLAIGGSGGAAGTGGNAQATNAGAIRTLGALSDGILAQSVGGGGGIGGAASASAAGQDASAGSLGLGGGGGAGGAGGLATVTSAVGSSISTAGVSAMGMVAQSIGGGGGRGSVSAAKSGALKDMTLSMGGAAGISGDGGGVVVTSGGALATSGKHAVGILAQSIGGGGGLARVLSTDQTGNQDDNPGDTQADDFQIDLGFGRDGAGGGKGGDVQITSSAAIQTTGRNAHGIVGQSIGGGGGMAVGGTAAGQHFVFGGKGGAGGDGGSVTVGTNTGGGVTTSGDGAIGIWAQSIGGGGGIGGDTASSVTPLAFSGNSGGSGNGNTVTVKVTNSLVRASGQNAAAIFAQSVGGGGGHVATSTGAVTGSAGGHGTGGNVTVDLTSGSAAAHGAGSTGILAQSAGTSSNKIAISVDQASSVTGGSGAAAIGLMGGTANTVNNAGTITAGANGYAILTDSAAANTTVTNTGTITGSQRFGGADTFVDNRPGGVIALGRIVDLGGGGQLRNSGLLIVGESGRTGRADWSGDLHHARSGRLVVDIDAENAAADMIALDGQARLEGKLVVNPISLARTTARVMTVAGGLRVYDTFAALPSHVFVFTPQVDGGALSVATDANFTGVRGAEGRGSVARYLQRVWDDGRGGFGTGFADLAAVAADDFGRALDGISGRGLGGIAFGRFDAGNRLARTGFSCQTFAGAGLNLVEQDCGWLRVIGDDGERDRTGSQPGYQTRSTTTALGGQREIVPGWFLGGAIAYETSRLSADGNRTHVDGDAVLGTVALKRQQGPWLFAGALDFGHGWYDSHRRIDLGDGAVAKASPRAWNGGLHLRGVWQRTFEGWYLEPGLEFDASYVRMDGFTEKGAVPYDLRVASSDGVVLAATPTLKVGSRVDLEGGTVLHLWSAAGVSFYDGNDWEIDASLAGTSGGGGFGAPLAGPDAVARINAGVDVLTEGRFNVRLLAQAGTGSDWEEYGGQIRVELLF